MVRRADSDGRICVQKREPVAAGALDSASSTPTHTTVSLRDPRTTEILRQLQAKMAEMEKIVGEVGGLVTQLAGEEDEATARAVERTRRAFQVLRGAHRQGARLLKAR